MGIVQNIPRKQGRINQHPTKQGVAAGVFGPRGQAGANVGDAANPGNPSYLTAVGVDYNSRLSKTGANGVNPVGSHSDIATSLYYPPLVPNHSSSVVTQDKSKDVGTHEKGRFFAMKPNKLAAQRTSGGVDANSNTPFHPKRAIIERPRRYPQKPGERHNAIGMTSTRTLGPQLGAGVSEGRWGTIKRSASDGDVPHHSTLAGPHGSVGVGSGTTGSIPTGSGKAVNVIQNAHSGSPFVVAWVPQPRSSQPSERGTTFPIKQDCRYNPEACG